jgi:anthranilate/para-aminobenzoate synthase component I
VSPYQEALAALTDAATRLGSAASYQVHPIATSFDLPAVTSTITRQAFEAAVVSAREPIHRGDAIQIVLGSANLAPSRWMN